MKAEEERVGYCLLQKLLPQSRCVSIAPVPVNLSKLAGFFELHDKPISRWHSLSMAWHWRIFFLTTRCWNLSGPVVNWQSGWPQIKAPHSSLRDLLRMSFIAIPVSIAADIKGIVGLYFLSFGKTVFTNVLVTSTNIWPFLLVIPSMLTRSVRIVFRIHAEVLPSKSYWLGDIVWLCKFSAVASTFTVWYWDAWMCSPAGHDEFVLA